MKETIKRLTGPINRQRVWLERVKYLGRNVRFEDQGHQSVREIMSTGVGALGKIGESELRGLQCYLRNRSSDDSCNNWDKRSERLYTNAGVFPNSAEGFTDFALTMLDALPDIDCLAVWFNHGEYSVVRDYCPKASLVWLNCLEPQLWQRPWMSLFRGKKVLAISPFADSIQKQHTRLEKVWEKKPEMAGPYQLETIKTPLAAALVESPYPTWKAGFDDLCQQMEDSQFDVAIIGAGAWSLPLAVRAKRIGKIGIHLGGPTQLIFGILGNRWLKMPEHNVFFNSHWVHPSEAERPSTFQKIEGGCYW